MAYNRIFAGLLFLSLCGGALAAGFTRTARGIIVAAEKNIQVRLEVEGEGIVRVSATADKSFADGKSLILVEQPAPAPFEVRQDGEAVELTTAKLRATIAPDGRVAFRDKATGRLLLEEDSRSLRPIAVEGTKGYTARQIFKDVFPQEAIYGLGQHQANEWDYKGKSEELFQYNTKVSVPFIVSTEGYGLLWDSYSLCRWGRADDYMQLGEAFNIYDKAGKRGALTGTYTPAKGSKIVRREKSINFEHLLRGDLGHVVNAPRDFRFAGSRVEFEGDIEAKATGKHCFLMYYSGYQTIELDGKVVVPERWRTAWNPNSYKFTLDLEKGKRHHIKIMWEPNGEVAYCGLRAYQPSQDTRMSWWGEMQDMIDYHFVYGQTMDGVIAGYRQLTGKAQIMPKWAMGYWQSREKYNTQAEVLGTLREFRRRQIPIDNIVIDWLHWKQDAWGSHEFDRDRFPTPKEMVDTIHQMGARVMISVWPKFYATTDHFKEFDSKGWMYRQAIRDGIKDWVGPGYLGSFYDAYSAGARKLFWHQMEEHYMPLGIDAWWMDASEPNIRDCTDIDYRKALCGPTAMGPSTKYFNAYALMNAEAIYDGQRGAEPDKRVFLLTRSGFAGLQRYSTATWSGDIATRWEDMEAQIRAGLNFAASGIPFWTMDIGGFCVEDRYVAAAKEKGESADRKEWRELNTRWYQFGAFCPLFRAHGQWPFREVFNIAPPDHPAYESIVYYTRLRYRLLPYIYSLDAKVHFDDYTMMRPMAMDFTSDRATYALGDQYMFGPALLAAPVYKYGARSRQVYLPAGSVWYDFYTGAQIAGGGTKTVAAPYGRMPLYVRGGSIIPVGPEKQSTAEADDGSLTILVYAGADGSFTLYDDDGTSYAYERGECATIPLSYDNAARTLTIGKRAGSYKGMPQKRRITIALIDQDHQWSVDSAEGKTIDYAGEKVEVRL